MTVEQILAHETQNMGNVNPLVCLGDAALHDGDLTVRVVLYQHRGEPMDDLGTLVIDRLVAFAEDTQLFSAIAKSWWEKP